MYYNTKVYLMLLVILFLLIPLSLNNLYYPTKNDKDIELLSRIITAECGVCDTAEKRMVASVVMNRVYSDLFPNTVEEVLRQDNQFAGYLSKHYKDTNRGVATEVYSGINRYKGILFFFHKNSRYKLNIPLKIVYRKKEHYYATTR